MRAMELVRDAPPSAEKAIVLAERARLLMVALPYDEAVAVGVEGLADGGGARARHGRRIRAGHDRDGRYSGPVETGDAERGARELERGIEVGKRAHAAQHVQRGYVNLAEFRSKHGQLDDARSSSSGALAATPRSSATRTGRAGSTPPSAGSPSTRATGPTPSAAPTRSSPWSRRSAYYTEGVARDVRAEVRPRARRRARRGRAEAELGLAASRSVGDPQAVGPLLVTLARVRLEEGRSTMPTALVDELLALGRRGLRALGVDRRTPPGSPAASAAWTPGSRARRRSARLPLSTSAGLRRAETTRPRQRRSRRRAIAPTRRTRGSARRSRSPPPGGAATPRTRSGACGRVLPLGRRDGVAPPLRGAAGRDGLVASSV